MNPSTDNSFPDEEVPTFLERLVWTAQKYRRIAWLVFLVSSLVLFISWMPPQMRVLIWQALTSRGILSSLMIVFSLLAISLVWSTGQRLDVYAFLFFNLRGPRPLWLDRMMLCFTQIGSGIVSLVIGLVLFVCEQRLASYELILGTLTLWIIVELVKALVRRSRPFFKVTRARIVGYRARGRSFPSGHTSQAFFLATMVTSHYSHSVWVAFLLYVLAILVGVTRIYIGAHYPRDVVAGAILGSVWGLLGALIP